MKKILPVEYPIVTGYPVIANALSILQTRPETMNWILLNLAVPIVLYDEGNDKILVDLGGSHTPWNTRYLYDDCPYLTVYRYDRTWFHRQGQDILAFIKWNIDRGRYLYTDVCMQPITEYQCSLPQKMHDLFLYGYDQTEQLLFCSDFFRGEKYRSISVPFEDYRRAFEAVEGQKLPHRIEQTTDIMALEHRTLFNTWLAVDYEDPKQVPAILKERILECLGKKNPDYMRLDDNKTAYGVQGYDLLQKYILEKDFYTQKYSYYNRMCVQFLLEHKQVLAEICRRILKDEILYRQAERLVNSCTILKTCILKLTLKGQCTEEGRAKLIQRLDDLKEQEILLLDSILHAVNQ